MIDRNFDFVVFTVLAQDKTDQIVQISSRVLVKPAHFVIGLCIDLLKNHCERRQGWCVQHFSSDLKGGVKRENRSYNPEKKVRWIPANRMMEGRGSFTFYGKMKIVG